MTRPVLVIGCFLSCSCVKSTLFHKNDLFVHMGQGPKETILFTALLTVPVLTRPYTHIPKLSSDLIIIPEQSNDIIYLVLLPVLRLRRITCGDI